MSGHTPGSWTFSRTPTYWKLCHPSLSTMKGPKVLAMVLHTNPNAEHDARLIAAAPDLLGALVSLERLAGQPLMHAEQVRIDARAAIAKATGEKA